MVGGDVSLQMSESDTNQTAFFIEGDDVEIVDKPNIPG